MPMLFTLLILGVHFQGLAERALFAFYFSIHYL